MSRSFEDMALDAIESAKASGVSHKELADAWGVTVQGVSNIVKRLRDGGRLQAINKKRLFAWMNKPTVIASEESLDINWSAVADEFRKIADTIEKDGLSDSFKGRSLNRFLSTMMSEFGSVLNGL
jgi:hypothetical protein